uniref:Reverse transcriptase domain-containing protein n=1 Tax=Meloidogyne hapla TaxID=6305 RepID=A0A1I8B4I5_MELHA
MNVLENNLFSQYQFGFIPKRSTTTQMILTLNKWYEGLINKENIDVIYVDFQKAFDKVPISYLLDKLYLYGIRGKIHKWIKNFLHNRTFSVRINDETSTIFPTYSGVPQGTILGPLLFTIYINDLPSILEDRIFPSLYADDLKITYSYKLNNNLLQDKINLLTDWADDWGLPIAFNKSYILNIGNKNPKNTYSIRDHKVEQVDVVKDLGIFVDDKLTFNKHIKIICRNAFLRSHQLLRTIHTYNPKTWGNIFKTYVLPILEYASPIWNPKQKDLIKSLERVQKFYTRSALNKCRKTKLKYQDRLKLFQLEPLLLRRYYLDVITMYKIYFNLTSLNPGELFTLNSRPSRKHNHIIQVSNKNNRTSNSFINRTISIWNLLPKEIFVGHTLTKFKIHLKLCLPQILEKLKISI